MIVRMSLLGSSPYLLAIAANSSGAYGLDDLVVAFVIVACVVFKLKLEVFTL